MNKQALALVSIVAWSLFSAAPSLGFSDETKDHEKITTVTIIVDGMLKSKSGAT